MKVNRVWVCRFGTEGLADVTTTQNSHAVLFPILVLGIEPLCVSPAPFLPLFWNRISLPCSSGLEAPCRPSRLWTCDPLASASESTARPDWTYFPVPAKEFGLHRLAGCALNVFQNSSGNDAFKQSPLTHDLGMSWFIWVFIQYCSKALLFSPTDLKYFLPNLLWGYRYSLRITYFTLIFNYIFWSCYYVNKITSHKEEREHGWFFYLRRLHWKRHLSMRIY